MRELTELQPNEANFHVVKSAYQRLENQENPELKPAFRDNYLETVD